MADTATSGRLRRMGGNLLLATGSILIALVLAEILVRWFDPQQLVSLRPDIWEPVDSVGWRFRPNVNTTYSTGERWVHIVTDSSGYRMARTGRPNGSKRVLLIGDSFMAAMQVEYEQSLAGYLEQRLPRELGQPVAVWNTGQVAWDPPAYYLQTRAALDRQSYDLVVVSLYLGNDIVPKWIKVMPPLQPEVVHHLRFPHHFSKHELVDAIFYPLNDFLKVHSQLFIFFKTRLHGLLVRLGLSADYFPVEFLRRQATSPRWHVTTEICQAIADVAAQHHLPILFVLVPTSFQVNPAVFQEFVRGFKLDSTAVDLEQPTRLMRDSLQAHHLRVIDALPPFREAETVGPSLYGTVDKHLSPRGHEVMADIVEPTIAELLRSSRRPGSRR